MYPPSHPGEGAQGPTDQAKPSPVVVRSVANRVDPRPRRAEGRRKPPNNGAPAVAPSCTEVRKLPSDDVRKESEGPRCTVAVGQKPKVVGRAAGGSSHLCTLQRLDSMFGCGS